MAEIVGVALAVPGIIDVVIRGGEAVYNTIDTFRKVDETLTRFRETALDIREGTLFFSLTALKTASSDRLVPAAIKTQLESALSHTENALATASQGLSYVHEDTILGKLRYALWKGKGSKSLLDRNYETLERSCNELKNLCLQLHNYRTAQSSFLLTSDVFKLRHETVDNCPSSRLPDSDISIATGNHARGGERMTADYILEIKSRENDVRFLSSKLSKEALQGCQGGLLAVLGYRQPPYNGPGGSKIFQLVVELPANTLRESLAHWICTKPPPTHLERLKLCLKLAEAVASVHSLGLLHKALRPRALLMATDARTPDAAAQVYLQDWTYVRELHGATTQLGEEEWPRRIYQHPERQGRYAESAYEPKHDVYSLGVCMLEVLLWKPFVIAIPGQQPESLQVCQLFERYGLARGEHNGGLPARYHGDSAKLTSRPWATKTIWQDIARQELREEALRNLVLQCLDGDIASAKEVMSQLALLIN